MHNIQLIQANSFDRVDKSKSKTIVKNTLGYYLLLLGCISFLTNCNKNNSNDPLNPPIDLNFKPGPFKVTVLYRSENTASIKWSVPEDQDNDTLRYSIFLNGTKVDSNLLAINYDFHKLTAQSIYNGQVVAVDPAGDTSIASFTLPAFSGYLYYTSDYSEYRFNRLDIATGKVSWYFTDPGASTFQIPAVVNDTLFVFEPGNRKLHAINLKTGIAYWSAPLPTNFFLGMQTFSPIVYDNGKLFLIVDTYLLAFKSTDGAFLWKFPTNGGVIQTNPTAANGVVYFGCNDRKMYAIDASTGLKKWEYDSGQMISWSSPTVAENTVIFVNSTRLVALNALTGLPRWATTVPDPIEYTGNCGRVINGVLYVTIGSTVSAHDVMTGVLKWTQPIQASQASNPTIDDNYLYLVVMPNTAPENVYALDRKTGQVKWKVKASASPFTDPIVAHNRLFTNNSELDASSGALIKSLNIGGSFVVNINDSIYYPAISGMLQ